MKKLTALLLALTLVLSLCVPVHAASGMVFDLTATNANGGASAFDSADSENWITNVKKGDRITVSLRVSAAPAVKTRIICSDISFNNDFFKVVSHATTPEGKLNGFGDSSCLTNGDGVKFIRFSSISDNDYTAEGTVIGTVVLEVTGDSDKSEVYCTNYGAIYYTGGRVPASTQNLSVCFGDKPPECSLEFESNGGAPVSTITLKKGKTATLPSTSKAYYNFVGWSLPDSDVVYKAGASVTVDRLYFHFSAVWDAVSAPDAPENLTAVRTTDPDMHDGKITGVTAEMEYSADGESWIACSGSEIQGLCAGTYCVRYREDPNKGPGTPAGEIAYVTILDGPRADAPTGLFGQKASTPEARDGKIVGTNSAMEYSVSEYFSTDVKRCGDGETVGLADGTYFVRYVKTATRGYSKATQVIIPSWAPRPAKPTGIRAIQESLPGAKDGRILGVTPEMEYSTDPISGKWTSCKGNEITGLTAGSYFVRLKENTTTEAPAGEIAEVQLRSGSQPAAPDDLVCVLPSRPGKADGIIAGTTERMEWSTDETGSKWFACEAGKTGGFAAGTYYFRYQADAETNTVASKCLEIVMEDPEFLLDGELSSLVEFSASVSGSTATVKNIDSEQLENALYSGCLELDLSELGKEVDSVKLPGSLFTQAADDAFSCSVAITLSNAIIDFDASAVASIAKQSSGKEIALSLKGKDSSALNTAQTEAIKSLDVSAAFAISLGAGKQITDFGNGTATIGVPFTVPAGKLAEGYSVWYIAEDGKTEKMPTAYRNGSLRFVVPHFSDYVVVYEKPVTLNFIDVLPGDWFYDNVKNAYAMDLIQGKSATTFNPNDNMTWAEAVTLAARMNERYSTGSITLANSPTGNGSNWYDSYVDYAIEKGILSGKLGDKANTAISRKDYVDIFYNALPMEAYAEKNSVTRIPDLASDTTNAKIYTFYRAGILTGYANTPGKVDGAFGPNDNIRRSEVATILIRMMDAGTRVSFTL